MELYLVLGIGLGLLGVATLFFSMLFRKVVPTNEVHVAQKGKNTIAYGKDTGEGNTYYKIPSWVPFFGIEVKSLPISIFKIELDAYEAYDKGRLQFLVDIVAFFRINDYSMAAQKVSNLDQLEDQLTSIVQGSVRSILAKSDIETIMEERSFFGDKFTQEVKEQLKAWGVEAVKNIELMDVKDAKDSHIIHNIMAKKKSHIEMESRLEVAKNKKFAEVAEIEARREVDLQKQDYQQQVGLRTVEAQQRVEIAEESKKQTVIEQSKLTAERELEVQKIKTLKAAEIEKEAAIVNSNRDKEVEIINANRLKEVALLKASQDKEAGLIKADQEFQVKTKLADAEFTVKKKNAEADLDVKLKSAQGIAAEGKAKAEAETAMLLAPVEAQTTLAQKIGENKEYQQYLITLEKVKADQAVGVAQAQALAKAEIKVIANTGNVNNGINSVKDLISSNGGTQLGTMIEGFANTEMGKQILHKAGLGTEQ
jgi:flotillin